jgi:hypothetical protein
VGVAIDFGRDVYLAGNTSEPEDNAETVSVCDVLHTQTTLAHVFFHGDEKQVVLYQVSVLVSFFNSWCSRSHPQAPAPEGA